jgi:amino acid transporter
MLLSLIYIVGEKIVRPKTDRLKIADKHDSEELNKFGYQQQLRRSMGGFSSFAISFSLISIITGISANFGYGLQLVGPWILWSWSVVAVGQFLVALVMADLSTRLPISGYGYQWTSRLMNPHFGYFVGWLLLLQFLTGFPGVCQALADIIYGMISGGSWTVTWITVGVISFITLIHLYGIRIASFVNDIGVYAEITGALAITLVLLGLYIFSGQFDFSILFNRTNFQTGHPAGFSVFGLSLLMGAWCLTGFEAAADLAEETHQPRTIVPRAVITSQVGAAIGGFLMLLGLILSINDLADVQQSESPLILILESAFGSRWMSLVGVVMIFSILACGVASMATATRLIYSMARDNILPFSSYLQNVHKTFKVPRKATIFVWAISCAFVIIVRRLEYITSISAVAGYFGYCGIMLAAILSTRQEKSVGGFSLKKWRRPVQVTALLWTLVVVAALTIPATNIEGSSETHLPAKYTLVATFIGVVVYVVRIRKRINRGEAGPPVSAD